MSNPYPIPRELRQSGILLGDGGNTYGPFEFKIFDVDDVEVFVRPVDAATFQPVAVEVSKVSGFHLDFFTIEFPFALASTTSYIVRSARLHERSVGVNNGTRIDPSALEKELSKQGTVLQEIVRDASRTLKVDFGAGKGLIVDSDIGDGRTLMKDGDRLVAGPDIVGLSADAEAARDLAQQYASDAAVVSGVNVPIYASRASAGGASIAAGVKAITTQFYAPNYVVPGTLVGGANYRRVAVEPTHDLKIRSTDRFLPNGTADAANGGWWELAEPVLYPEMAGARADGTTPDDTPIRNCLLYLHFRGGGELRFEGDIYRLSVGNLPCYDNIFLHSPSRRSTLRLDQGVIAQVLFTPERLTKPLWNFSIFGITFDCQALGIEPYAVSAVSFEGFVNLSIRFCVMKNCTAYGFGAQATSTHPTYHQVQERLVLEGNQFFNCGFNGTADPADAVDIKTVNGALIVDNTVDGAADNGFNIRGQGIVVRGNKAKNCANIGFSIGNGQGLPCDVDMSTNYAENCGVDGAQFVIANVGPSVMLIVKLKDFHAKNCGANGVRTYESVSTTGNLILQASELMLDTCGFNGINQAVPNAKSVSVIGLTAQDCTQSGIGTSGSGEMWLGLTLQRCGLNGIREAAGANDNRFLGAYFEDIVGNNVVLFGSRSMVSLQAGDAPLALRTGYGENWVNYLQVEGRQTGGGPRISAEGADPNIPLGVSTRGGGLHQWYTNSFGTEIMRAGAPGGGNAALLVAVNKAGSVILKQVSFGADDSGGAGYMVLRVPN